MSAENDLQRLMANVSSGSLSRRDLIKRAGVLGLSTAGFATLLAACETDDAADDAPVDVDDDDDPAVDPVDDEDDDEPEPDDDEPDEDPVDDERYGGTLNVALRGEPPSLDVMPVTSEVVGLTMLHVFELPFTWDAEMQVTPELVDNLETSDDGLTNTLTFREGVQFHNGEEMTGADILASIERWFEISPRSSGLIDFVDDVEQGDDNAIVFHMSEAYGAFSSVLARQTGGCTISPASVIDGDGLSEYIGTGPYQLVEHMPDRHIHLGRFEDYVARDDEPSGYAGRKHAYFDEIFFFPVPDEAARVAGLQSGEYHYLDSPSPDQFEALDGVEGVTVEILPPVRSTLVVFNTSEGVMADVTMRRAIQAALDLDEVLLAGVGEGYYSLDPGVMMEGTAWHTTVGEELYNQGDLDRAGELGEEAGYDGETLRILARTDQPDLFNMAVMADQQIQDAGFETELQRYDQASFFEVREDPDAWEIFLTNAGFSNDPLLISYISATTWPGWWDSDRKVELVSQLGAETDFDARYELWEELQRVFYEEDVPMVKIGNVVNLDARSSQIGGFEPITMVAGGLGFWNWWLEE